MTDPSTIRLLVLDVDGTLTDGSVYISETGDEFKRYDVKDGRGIIEVQRTGVRVAFLSASTSRHTVLRRAEMLGVDLCHVGSGDKRAILDAWLDDLGLTPGQVAFIGDDVNDLTAVRHVGLSACPSDAVDVVKRAVDVVLERPGGHGCVREFIDRFLGPIGAD